MAGRERGVARRVPVLRHHNEAEMPRYRIDDRHDFIGILDRQRTAGREAFLDIDNNKSVGGAGCDRRGARATGRKRAGYTKTQQAEREGAAIEAKRMWHTWPSQLATN